MREEDHERFMRLYSKTQPALRLYLLAVAGSIRDVEDLLQDVSVVLCKKFDQYDGRQPFTHWAIGIARLQVLRTRRDYARHPLCIDGELAERAAGRAVELSTEFESQRLYVRECLKKLPEQQREIIRLRYEENRQASNLAEQFQKSEPAICMLLSRIRAALADCVRRRMSMENAPATITGGSDVR